MLAIFIAGQVGWFFILERWWFYKCMSHKKNGLMYSLEKAIGDVCGLGSPAMVMRAREVLQAKIPPLSRHLGTIAVLAGTARRMYGLE